MNRLGLGRLNAFGLGTPGAVSTSEVVNDLVIELVSEVTWPIVVDLHGDEHKRKDYDKGKRKL